MRKLALLIIITMIIGACSKENTSSTDSKSTSNKTSKRLVQISKDKKLYAKIYYKGNLISGIDYFKDSRLDRRLKMIYENNRMVTREFYGPTDNLLDYEKYLYEENLVVKRENYRKDKKGNFYMSSYTTYENQKGKINNLIGSKYYENDVLISYYKIQYNDDLGSSTSTGYDATGNVKYIATWVKDNKIAFDKYFDPFPYQHEHNNISITHDNIQNKKYSWSYTSVFTYDEQGYPLTSIKTKSDRTIENYEYLWDEIK